MSTVDLPNIREPFIDQRTGQISRAWWIWLQQLMTRIGGSGGTDISVIETLVRELIILTAEQGNEIAGHAALPLTDPEVPFDPSQVGAVPADYSALSPVQSVFGRTGAVTAQNGDYTVGQVTNAASVLSTLSQFAATTSAQLAGVLSDETGSGAAVFGNQPTLNQPNIVGTTTNDNAAAGSVGEYSTGTSGSVGVTTAGVTQNIHSISLTAGDWDVEGVINYQPAGGTTTGALFTGISTTSATLGALGTLTLLNFTTPVGVQQSIPTPNVRISLSGTTTVYLVTNAGFSGGTLNAVGFIRARRIR